MDILTPVANLWHDPKEGFTFSGWMTLPHPLPAGVGLKVVAVPVPLRGKKEKWELHVAIPYPDAPPAPPGPDDIRFKGEVMNQWFADPEPSNRRNKILIWGESGTGKTKTALSFPACAYMDNHGSAEKYRIAYLGKHQFFPPRPDILPTPDNVGGAIAYLLKTLGTASPWCWMTSPVGDPILILRNRMIQNKAAKNKLHPYETMAITIKAWNYYRENPKIKTLRWSGGQGEAFPEPI